MATSKELLTNLADELRTLTNTTDKMGLSVMAGHVSDANAEVDEQDALVTELMAALQGKSVPGGSGGAVETCTLTLSTDVTGAYLTRYVLESYENGSRVVRYGSALMGTAPSLPFSTTVVCGSPFYVEFYNSSASVQLSCSGVTGENVGKLMAGEITAEPGETATIHMRIYD